MTTHRQIAANKRNASRSTGPRTDAGKERSSRNAMTHGLVSIRVQGIGKEFSKQLVELLASELQIDQELARDALLAHIRIRKVREAYFELLKKPWPEATGDWEAARKAVRDALSRVDQMEAMVAKLDRYERLAQEFKTRVGQRVGFIGLERRLAETSHWRHRVG